MQNESNKTSSFTRTATAIIGLVLVGTFVFGLSHSISSGFAGFEGGLPFAIITTFVMCLVLYDVWNECLSKRK